MTSRDLEGQGHDRNTLRAHYAENSWRCYLATIMLITRYHSAVSLQYGQLAYSDSLASCFVLLYKGRRRRRNGEICVRLIRE